jgi:hypothetical protein
MAIPFDRPSIPLRMTFDLLIEEDTQYNRGCIVVYTSNNTCSGEFIIFKIYTNGNSYTRHPRRSYR